MIATRIRWFLAGILLSGWLAGSAPQSASIPFYDTEQIRAENLILKLRAAQKESLEFQIKYQASARVEREYIDKLKLLGVEILKDHGVTAEEYFLSWDTFSLEKVPPPTPKPQ